jgi:hypothetical protein
MANRLILWVAIGLLAGAVAVWYWPYEAEPPATPPSSPVLGTLAEPTPAAPVASGVAPPAAPVTAEAATEPGPEPPMTASDIAPALAELIGGKAVQSFLHIDDFARRFVATVDNLGRSHAPPLMWPVNPTEGRFTVEERDGATVASPDNSLRYTPFVLLVETVDIARTVRLYRRMTPLLQRAYTDLGYPGRSFDARLVEVIDLLLATPSTPEPLKVQLTEVKGSVPSVRPWVRYEFADPALESLAAGQKILMRVGPVNQRRLKAKLVEIRAAMLAGGAPR